MDKPLPFIQKATYLLLFIIATVFILIAAQDFLVPLAFGLLLSSLLYPACRFLCRFGLPKGLSIFLALLFMMLLIGGLSVIFISEIAQLAEDFPGIRQKAFDNINQLSQYIEDNVGVSVAVQKNWVKDQLNNMFDSGSKVFNNLLDATAGTLFKLLIMPVFTYYILFYHERFRHFILQLAAKKRQDDVSRILREISFVSQRFFGGAFVVVMLLVVINSAGLYFIGLKYPILFGVISAFLNFIPYFGTWIGAFFPFMFALLTGDSINLALGVIIFFAFIQFTENNILTPNITGGYVKLNPFITILGLIAGGMIWGVAGMLLVIPFMASLKIIFENIDATHKLAYLIGSHKQQSISSIGNRIRAFLRLKKIRRNDKTKNIGSQSRE
ncbi:MAG TPA: AI-2E family transporter [Bacteroidales bacterium]|nr:AI-2E family transporter [Bacteroidales bacterium]